MVNKILKVPGKVISLFRYIAQLKKEKYTKKFILVTGGEWNNKGAQAMLFVTMTELAKRMPEYDLCAVVPQYLINRDDSWKNFKFRVLPDVVCREPAYYVLGGKWFIEALKRRESFKYMLYAKKIWKNTAYVFDISGYAIGKKWGHDKSKRCAMLGAIAKKVGAKCYYLPQSFGPFDFELPEDKKKKHSAIMREWLSKADILCAREKVGKKMLEETYGLSNVVYMQDIVLQNKEYILENIYDKKPHIQKLQVLPKSVALIPNKHLTKMKPNNAYELWEKIINKLVALQYNVYLLVHSGDDVEVIEALKEKFDDNDKVILVKEDLSCIEYDIAVSKFDFLIASRYHSIVHAYRRGVPCIVLGWADKYEVLLDDVHQLDFMFDMRKDLTAEEISVGIDKMIYEREENSKVINEAVEKIQKENIFDKIL